MKGCVFCEIVAGREKATIAYSSDEVVAFEPLNPVTEGHLLVIPYEHVDDASEAPAITGIVMQAACDLAADIGPCNIITSVGAEATQSVFHLHIHVVPRRADDGLRLPWSPADASTSDGASG